MQRRTFLKWGLAAGAAAVCDIVPHRATALGTTYAGPCLLVLNAVGGWDPTLFCDPKIPHDGVVINHAYGNEVGSLGAFRYAPVTLKNSSGVRLASVADFFARYGSRLCVINGIDMGTNSHTVGVRAMDSGNVTDEVPNVAALVGAHAAAVSAMPCPYVTDAQAYAAPLDATTLTYPRSDQLLSLARYTEYAPGQATDPLLASVRARVTRASDNRLRQTWTRSALATDAALESRLTTARRDAGGLRTLLEALPPSPVKIAEACPDIVGYDSVLEGALQSVEFALTSFAAGTSAGASLGFSGFDTHREHDIFQAESMGRMLRVFGYAVDKADALGLRGRLTIVVVSDFARPPFYNTDRGKDHWNITSAIALGPAIQGGRVVGATDAGQKVLAVSAADPTKLATGGVVITPTHLHQELRRVTGLGGTSLDRRYRLVGPQAPLRLFG